MKQSRRHLIESPVILGLDFAFLFFAFATTRLGAQGIYYDEVHQATASFAYLGQPPYQFANLTFGNIPIMNMNYSGAIKTAIYGIYLRTFDLKFNLISWRLVGILLVTVGIFLFGIIIGYRLPRVGLLSFFVFLITDISMLLTSRHDWGPTALSFSFRLLLISIWLRGELSKDLRTSNSFWLSLIFGLSLFEKLSSVALLITIFLLILSNKKRRNIHHIMASLTGGIVGLQPLLFANVLSYFFRGRYFISLQFQASEHPLKLSEFASTLKEYFSLGAGERVKFFILGDSQPILNNLEFILFTLFILFVVFVLVRSRTSDKLIYLSGIMLFSYFSIIISIYLLPQITWAHHWVMATPFQYAAMSLFLAGLFSEREQYEARSTKISAVIILVVFCTLRISGLVLLETSLIQGDASESWDPAYTKIGKYAANKEDALFVAGDWGVANQIICYTNGQPDRIIQPNWSDQGVEHTVNVITSGNHSEVYIVFPAQLPFLSKERKDGILLALEQSLSPGWIEMPVEIELNDLRALSIYKFERAQR